MQFKGGRTYTHEHITIDLSGPKQDEDCKLDDFDETVKEFKELKEENVFNIIDLTNRGMGRNVDYVMKVKEKTGINIVCSTGYYKEPFLPKEVYELSEKELSKIMIDEIVNGIEKSGIKAEVIGEIGTGKEAIKPEEEKVFKAASRAHVETGRAIVTHTTLGKLGLEQIKIFKAFNVNLDKVVISHVDLSGNLDYIVRLIDMGVNVAFDTIGKIKYKPDEMRIDFIKKLCSMGLSSKIVLSMDITRKSHLKNRGGIGYRFLLQDFLPKLKKSGVSEENIKNMTEKNAMRIFC
ncbi:hydrolase [Clostridium sp. DMHC 10]|uniref:phosphotriesterase family protein n=1 Tax=Clostridium sp. DMHC 10 TaxID=747377 RepID=UPI00069CDCD0|nr:hydrolase [Clostridium sp. DMHC 10]KOF57732.1 hydrolase [Clostridium sp. DMHC 10]